MELHRSGNLDTTFDEPFEAKWVGLQRVTLCLLTLFVIAAAAGAFGRGPLAYATAQTPDGDVRLGYEHLARNRTPSNDVLRVAGSAAAANLIRVHLSAQLVNGLTIDSIAPRPVHEAAVGDSLELDFAHHGDAEIRLPYEPAQIGVIAGTVSVGDEPPIAVRTLVFP
jgi:hypothetical protein